MTNKTVIAFGEALWDLLPAGAVLGGAPTNFAYRINSLGDRTILITRLGADELGDRAARLMGELGLELDAVQRDAEHPTGTVDITLDENQQPDYLINPGVAYDHLELTDALAAAARQADCLCFGALIQRAPVSRRTLHALLDVVDEAGRALKFLDINLRKNCYSRETVAESLRRADVLKLNEDEARELAEMLALPGGGLVESVRALLERERLRHCVVTLAERGALCVSADGAVVYDPGYAVNLVDPCGSGDAFAGAFLHLLLRERPFAECCRLGNAFGALVATQHGATAPIAREEAEALLHDPAAQRVRDPRYERYAVSA